jgi:hypothetical protein
MVLDDEIVAIEFFVIAEIGHVRSDDGVRLGILVAGGVGRGRVIDQFHFIQRSIAAILESAFDEHILLSREKLDRPCVSARGASNRAISV